MGRFFGSEVIIIIINGSNLLRIVWEVGAHVGDVCKMLARATTQALMFFC